MPSAKRCWTCHNGEPGRALGFSAVQLADGDGPLPLQALSAEGLLTHPPAATELGPPGDETSRAALGYLHANCGHCHNPGGSARPDTDMVLRLDPAERDVAQTSLYRSNVGVALQNFSGGELSRRIVPGRPEQSGLVFRMHQRGTRAQMPPFGTEEVDPSGLRLVGDWIAQLE